MLQAIAGHDPRDPTSSTAPVPDYSASLVEDIKGVTIGLPRHYFFDPDPSVNAESVAVVEKAVAELEGLGAKVRDVSLPSLGLCAGCQLGHHGERGLCLPRTHLKTIPEKFGDIVRSRFRTGGC